MLYNSVKFRGISRNSVTFFMYGIPYIFKKTHLKAMYSLGADVVWSYVPHSPPSICRFFWFIMYIPMVHDKFFALKIEIQYKCSTFLARFGIWRSFAKNLICVSRPGGKSKRMLVHRTYTCRVGCSDFDFFSHFEE